MDALLLWVPYRTYMPSPQPLLRRLLAHGEGEISALVPGEEEPAEQFRRIRSARLVFVDQSFLNALHGQPPIPAYQLDRTVPQPQLRDLWDTVLRHPAPRVLGLTYNDLHWLNIPGNPNYCAENLAEFAPHFQAMMWHYEQWGEVASGTLPLRAEPWMEQSGSPVANWQTLARAIPARFDGVWALDPDEIKCTAARPCWDASVIGAHYSTRAAAYQSAVNAGLSLAPYRRLANLAGRAIRLRRCFFPARGHLDSALQRQVMDFTAARSAANFVCGGGVRYFVRKFMEMAALGSCMAAWPAGGLAAYGFCAGTHLAVCREPEDFGAEAKWLRSRAAVRSAMGRAAQSLVHARHTVGTRAAQLLAWLRELAAGRMCSGRHEEGEFCLTPA